MHCTYCGSKGHKIGLCPKTLDGQANRRNLRCSYCGAKDHAIEACYKITPSHRLDDNKRYTD